MSRIIILFLTLLLSLSSTLGAPYGGTRHRPVQWLTNFGGRIKADIEMTLAYKGGNGYGWEIFYIPQWQGQADYHPVDIVTNTTSNSITWRTPPYSTYPAGTTFILGVTDGSNNLSADWYDLTGLLKFEP
ncbi:hypothetical protein M231_04204 [Tremella mesenterica]|uniref:Uncharacterized protein n=1 Tax=Tremella mesenterica TaxID=5217 RepID=A0A4Q1BLA2_TREME|nr:hypothetical protein M231_04204 [Tremella mesenterica]